MTSQRPVAIVATAATPVHSAYAGPEAGLVMSCVNDLLAATGLTREELAFTIAGSCDYLGGTPFSFVMNLDGVGAWPPVYESHVEMDGAWALFEAWLRLQVGDVDTALVIGSGKSSSGDQRRVFALQTDPYTMAPLGLDPVSLAGIQARALLDAGLATEADFAATAARSGAGSLDALLAAPYVSDPLRAHDVAVPGDGAAALVLVAGDRVRELTDTPVWITGMDHRIESRLPGLRDLTDSPSTRAAAAGAGADSGPLDLAELMVVHTPEETILRNALGLKAETAVNPSGGPLAGHPVMATGLARVVEVARRIAAGEAGRGLAHASSGPCLQQNLVAVLEGDR
ncbi:acetyl-CoA acetyltransferase [Actinocorallia herbida]|uniref:Acetyl-CoA acetyltransferase n=1 Tax=Actinocorallia herbida TaxID=58109 RepID=A0A3N1CUR5_9ACTN|nr:lipid-transfer protein [Actinocorallia herbida]ROO85049.1 acetyl-CoA acetyltransferase [Actinocorallia herbida]